MFSAKYHFSIDPNKNTITLKPTAGLWIKTAIWSFAPLAVLMGVGAIAQAVDRKKSYEEQTSEYPQYDS